MDTASKGNATEAAVLGAFVARGLHVLLPFGEGQSYDLVVALPNSRFLRVQCKTGRLLDECVVFNSRSTDHGRGRRPYSGLADIFGIYFAARKSVYLVPVDEIPGYCARFRLRSPRNNQRRGIRFASDYQIDRWTIEALCDVAANGGSRPETALSFA